MIIIATFGKILRELRNAENLTQTQLADAIGVAFSTISMYERGEREPDFETLESIADYFNVSMDRLLGNDSQKNIISPSNNGKLIFKQNTIPPFFTPTESKITFPVIVIGEAAAGYDFPSIEDWAGETMDVPISYLKGKNHNKFFVLKVKGDSMYPTYHDGDKVLILRQTALNYSGQVGVVLYDNLSTLKKIEYKTGEDWMRLVPINPTHPIEKIEGERLEHCRILGIPKLLIREIED